MADPLPIDITHLDQDKLNSFLSSLKPFQHIPAPLWTLDDYQKGSISIFKDAEGNNFIPGCYFRTHIDVQLDKKDKANILLGENNVLDSRIQKLNQFASAFKEVADKSKYLTPESVQTYVKTTNNFDITIDEAKVLQGNNQVKKEEFFAKTFHKQIHDVFGDYNGEVSKLLETGRAQDTENMKAFAHAPKGKYNLDDMTKYYQQKKQLQDDEAKLEKKNADGSEEFKDIGKEPGQFKPVCRHYAGIMSCMLDSAGVPTYAFTCNNGSHATVASLVTGNVFETTASSPEKNYRYSLNLKNPDDLRELKQTFYYTDRQGHITTIGTAKPGDIGVDQLEELAFRSALIEDKEKAIGGANKFGEKAALLHEQGHKPTVIPTLTEIKSLPKDKQPKIDPEIAAMLQKLRGYQNQYKHQDEPKPTYHGSQLRRGDTTIQSAY